MNERVMPPGMLTVVFLLSLAALPGCFGPFSGAAAMRIEVEVYKGPLSEEPEIQLGSLVGHIKDATNVLEETLKFATAVIASKGFPPPSVSVNSCKHVSADNPWYYMKFWRLFGVLDDLDHFDCVTLSTLVSEIQDAIDQTKKVSDKAIPLLGSTRVGSESTRRDLVSELRSIIQEIAGVSAILRHKAFRVAIASAAGQSLNSKVRIAVVDAIVSFSEVGNQLKTRADALAKQLESNTGLDRRELPPGVALRDSEPTDFIRLYKWWNASQPELVGKFVQGIGWSEDRVKSIEKLFTDHYWSRINTVYASGRGKVRMAFIKDDVGNWNLKSYDNNPEELLQAYTDFSIATIKKASKIAQDMSPVGPAVQTTDLVGKLIRTASETAFNAPITPVQAPEMTILLRLRKKAELELRTQAVQHAQKEQVLLDNYEKAKNVLKPTPENSESKAKVAEAATALADKRRNTIKEFRKIIEDHGNSIDVIASGLEEVKEPVEEKELPAPTSILSNTKLPSVAK